MSRSIGKPWLTVGGDIVMISAGFSKKKVPTGYKGRSAVVASCTTMLTRPIPALLGGVRHRNSPVDGTKRGKRGETTPPKKQRGFTKGKTRGR